MRVAAALLVALTLPLGIPDGARHDTFWNRHWIEIPGLTVGEVHCHGRMTFGFAVSNPVMPGYPQLTNPCVTEMQKGEHSRYR